MSKFSEYSFSKHLRSNNKSSDEFEFMLNKLTLEEIIALKLELSSRFISGKLYGFNLWKIFPKIAQEALLLFAVSATTNLPEAQALLGIATDDKFRQILRRHTKSLELYGVGALEKRNYLKHSMKIGSYLIRKEEKEQLNQDTDKT
jgi:hypothetical protein